MEIRYRDILLRDMTESDIEDWIRWYNEETRWCQWDTPGEELEPVDPEEFRAQRLESLSWRWDSDFRNFFELDTGDGHHIGMVTSYAIGDDFNWMSWKDAYEKGTFSYAIGIDICDSRFWGRGLGTQAITAFMRHFLEHGIREICLQTWSGNVRMLRAARRVGFTECHRITGNRRSGEKIYDSVTFRLDLDRFHKYLKDNP